MGEMDAQQPSTWNLLSHGHRWPTIPEARINALGSPHRRLEVRLALAAAIDRQALLFPAFDRFAQLEESDDAGWDRHPEGDEAEDQDCREDRLLGDSEEDEGADHAG